GAGRRAGPPRPALRRPLGGPALRGPPPCPPRGDRGAERGRRRRGVRWLRALPRRSPRRAHAALRRGPGAAGGAGAAARRRILRRAPEARALRGVGGRGAAPPPPWAGGRCPPPAGGPAA